MHANAEKIIRQWFRVIKRQANPEIRLICFPHAGGSASFFHGWADLLPRDVELLAVRYPGREDRILDPLADTMADLAIPLAQACTALDDAPLAFFGHSMGAAVAHEVARRVEPLIAIRLAGLFVSGHAGPGYDKGRRDPSNLSDGDLIEDMKVLGGTDPEMLVDAELRQLYLPTLRADYRLIARHRISSADIIDAPVVAYYGDQDEDLDEESVSAWSTVTKSTFMAHRFSGGHFYLLDHSKDVVADICTRLRTDREIKAVNSTDRSHHG